MYVVKGNLFFIQMWGFKTESTHIHTNTLIKSITLVSSTKNKIKNGKCHYTWKNFKKSVS